MRISQNTEFHSLRHRQFLWIRCRGQLLTLYILKQKIDLLSFGESGLQHTLVVVHTYRGDVIRIISARTATSGERRDYERGKE